MVLLQLPTPSRRAMSRLLLAACVLAALGVGDRASPAHAATLRLRGPSGARVQVDGRDRGRLPLAGPLELKPGRHELRCSLAGHVSQVEWIDLPSADDALSLELQLLPRSRVAATGYSLLVAGLGQHYESRHRMGWTYLALQLGAAAAATLGELQMRDKRDSYETLYAQYQSAFNQQQAIARREAVSAAYDDMKRAQSLRNVGLVAVVGVAVLSAVDAWWRFPQGPVQVDLRVGASGGPEPGRDSEIRLAWKAAF